MSKNELGRARAIGHYNVRCIGPDGELKWEEEFDNMVVNVGLDHLLDVTLSNQSANAIWYVGLLAADTSPAAGWTNASLTGGEIFADFDEDPLPTWIGDGATTSQSVTNSASPASFAINQDTSSIGGAYLISNNNIDPTAGGGTLYSAGAFTGNKSADNGDTLLVTAAFSQADAV